MPTTINIVVTKLNLHEFSDFILESKFAHDVSFVVIKIAETSVINKELLLDALKELLEMMREISKIQLDSNFHIRLQRNLISKKRFLTAYSLEMPVDFAVFFNLHAGIFEIIDQRFFSYAELKDKYYLTCKCFTSMILEYLESKTDDFFFDPYELVSRKTGGKF